MIRFRFRVKIEDTISSLGRFVNRSSNANLWETQPVLLSPILLLTMQFVRDFLFTDINNHLEFFQYIQNLDTDDHVLMISLLERLVNHNQPLSTVSPFDNSSPAIRYQAFSHCPSSRLLLNAAAPPSAGYGSTNDAPESNNGASHINIDKRKLLGRTVSTVLPQPENILL